MGNFPLEHCPTDDPDVCLTCASSSAPSKYKALPGTKYCSRHGGCISLESIRKEAANQYRLQVWQERVSEFTESDHAKSLRGEIGILKMVLEQIINQCTGPVELLTYSGKIGDMVTRIEKTIVSCDRLERNMGMMLDKSTAMKLAADIVDLIAMNITDPETIDTISNGIIDLLKELK